MSPIRRLTNQRAAWLAELRARFPAGLTVWRTDPPSTVWRGTFPGRLARPAAAAWAVDVPVAGYAQLFPDGGAGFDFVELRAADPPAWYAVEAQAPPPDRFARRIRVAAGHDFTPLDLPALFGWWDAAALGSADFAATTFPDRSGRGNALGPGTGSYVANGRNGRGIMRFNGTSDRFNAFLKNPLSVTTPVTFFAAAQNTKLADAAEHCVAEIDGPQGAHQGLVFEASYVTNNWKMFSCASFSGGDIAITGAPDQSWHAFVVRAQNGARFAQLDAITTANTNVGTDVPIGRVCVGGLNSGGRLWQGDVGEVGLCGAALTANEIKALVEYLRARWAIP